MKNKTSLLSMQGRRELGGERGWEGGGGAPAPPLFPTAKFFST